MSNTTNKPILPINNQMQNKNGYLFIGLFVYLLGYLFIGLFSISAQTPTSDKVSDLKERIATQVAKLDIIKKKGVLGVITDSSNNQLIMADLKGGKRFIDVDELTRFTNLSGEQIGISDLKKDAEISVVGLYNTESRRLLARFIKVRQPSQILKGEVTDLDNKAFTLEVQDLETNNLKTVEVETTTKTMQWIKEQGITRSGFSKILIGERLIIFGKSKDTNTLTAIRILLLPELSPNIKASPTPLKSP